MARKRRKPKKNLTYRAAGVDIDEGEKLVKLIKPLAASTRRPGVVGSIGGFGGLFRAPTRGMRDPLLVSGTDGVGTKLLVAQAAKRHDTVGIDLVAMCVNDVVTCGAEPLFFLDYFSTGRLSARAGAAIVRGVARGCREARCALVGGETAEMPGLYTPGEYDLAGFCVGVVDRAKLLDGRAVRPGDALVGLASSGVHSNGLALARKVFARRELAGRWGRRLLKPTRIYVRPVLALAKAKLLRACAHITGGGLTGNLPRALPRGVRARIDRSTWRVPRLFAEVARRGRVREREMFRTFNMGVGMVCVVPRAKLSRARAILARDRVRAFEMGRVERGCRGVVYEPPLA